MHVLVATRATQGQRSDDFCWTVEGELVRFAFDACASPACGCDRAFAGLGSSRATTTAVVVDHPAYDRDLYRQAVLDGLVRQGFVTEPDPEDLAFVDELVDEQLAAAAELPPDTVVEIRNGTLRVRDPVG